MAKTAKKTQPEEVTFTTCIGACEGHLDEIARTQGYSRGGYPDREFNTIFYKCTLCGKIFINSDGYIRPYKGKRTEAEIRKLAPQAVGCFEGQ